MLKSQKGLSILEVLIATGIMGILMAGFASMMLSQNKETKAVAEILSAQDLMKSMIGALAKGDVCHYILSTKSFNALNVVNGTPQEIDIGTQPIYASMVTSGTPGPGLIKKGDKASAYTSSLVVDSIKFNVVSGTINGSIGHFTGTWVVSFDSNLSTRKLKPLSITAVITANTTVPSAASTIACLGSGGTVGTGDANYLAKWSTDTEINESVIFQDPVTGNIGVGTDTPATAFDVNGSLKIRYTSAPCSSLTEGALRYDSVGKNMEFCNGTVWGAVANPALEQIQVFKTTTNWKIPAGVKKIKIEIWGAGGGGGTSAYNDLVAGGGSGGGSGAYGLGYFDVNPGDNLIVSVGIGGSGGAGVPKYWDGSSGGSGGDSTVRVNGLEKIKARGGSGGGGAQVYSNHSVGTVGKGGAGCVGARYCIDGQDGRSGMWNYTSNTSVQGGYGGSNSDTGGGGDAGSKYSDTGGPHANGVYTASSGGNGRVIIYY